MTSVYVAGSYADRHRLHKEVAIPLRAAGHTVTSRWLLTNEDLCQETLAVDDRLGLLRGTQDLEDLEAADVVVLFTDTPSTTGGYHVEYGYAIGQGKPVEIVGPVLNVFHTFPVIVRHETIADFLRAWEVTPSPL